MKHLGLSLLLYHSDVQYLPVHNPDPKYKVFWRLFTVLVVPALIAAYGIFRAGLRRKEAARYRENLRRADARQEVA